MLRRRRAAQQPVRERAAEATFLVPSLGARAARWRTALP
jgi:hypothetical protein